MLGEMLDRLNRPLGNGGMLSLTASPAVIWDLVATLEDAMAVRKRADHLSL